MTGWRARIGILFPGNSLVDDELWQWVPGGVSVHINRPEASGIKVTDVRALNLDRDFGTVPASEAYRLARRADGPGADGVFIACTALPTLPVIEHLEEDLGKPVITANQATMWEALRLSGV